MARSGAETIPRSVRSRRVVAVMLAITVHSHMLDDTPHLFFLHHWAYGKPDALGAGLGAALRRVNLAGAPK